MAFQQDVFIFCIFSHPFEFIYKLLLKCIIQYCKQKPIADVVLQIRSGNQVLFKAFANMFHPVADLTCPLYVEGAQIVEHSSHSCQNFRAPWVVHLGGGADALFRTRLVPSVSSQLYQQVLPVSSMSITSN